MSTRPKTLIILRLIIYLRYIGQLSIKRRFNSKTDIYRGHTEKLFYFGWQDGGRGNVTPLKLWGMKICGVLRGTLSKGLKESEIPFGENIGLNSGPSPSCSHWHGSNLLREKLEKQLRKICNNPNDREWSIDQHWGSKDAENWYTLKVDPKGCGDSIDMTEKKESKTVYIKVFLIWATERMELSLSEMEKL